jgi:hypothetical protein
MTFSLIFHNLTIFPNFAKEKNKKSKILSRENSSMPGSAVMVLYSQVHHT